MSNIEEKIEKLLKNDIEKIGYDLYDVYYLKEGKNNVLRIFIDNKDGININDCEKVNNKVSEILDNENLIKDSYILEISSPGIERILRKEKHLKDNIEQEVEIKLFKPLNNKKQYIGILKQVDINTITIFDNQEIKIDRKDISIIKKTFC